MNLTDKISDLITQHLVKNPDTQFSEVFGALQVTQLHWEHQFVKVAHAKDLEKAKELHHD